MSPFPRVLIVLAAIYFGVFGLQLILASPTWEGALIGLRMLIGVAFAIAKLRRRPAGDAG